MKILHTNLNATAITLSVTDKTKILAKFFTIVFCAPVLGSNKATADSSLNYSISITGNTGHARGGITYDTDVAMSIFRLSSGELLLSPLYSRNLKSKNVRAIRLSSTGGKGCLQRGVLTCVTLRRVGGSMYSVHYSATVNVNGAPVTTQSDFTIGLEGASCSISVQGLKRNFYDDQNFQSASIVFKQCSYFSL